MATAVACTAMLVGEDDAPSPSALFDTIWTDFDRYYASFDLKGVDWNAAYARYRPEAVAATTPPELYDPIRRMLVELRDPHVVLAGPQESEIRSVDLSTIRTWFDLNLVLRNYLPGFRRTASRRIFYGLIGSDVGYLWIPSFDATGWAGDIDEVLAFFGSPAGVILDVRDNRGGLAANAEAIASRFADTTLRYGYVRYRNGPRHSDFTPFEGLDIKPAGPRRFAGPVIVLTNRRSVSAAEYFVLAMRARSGTTFVGDTTAGALSTPLLRELPDGSTLRVPQTIVYDPAKVTHEGIGLAPSLVVVNDSAGFEAGRDAQLEAAIAAAANARALLAQPARAAPRSGSGWPR
jgi:carboxyl-terminal processing protease